LPGRRRENLVDADRRAATSERRALGCNVAPDSGCHLPVLHGTEDDRGGHDAGEHEADSHNWSSGLRAQAPGLSFALKSVSEAWGLRVFADQL
jgi:hypothetical protein